jgi:hypothetical protein
MELAMQFSRANHLISLRKYDKIPEEYDKI